MKNFFRKILGIVATATLLFAPTVQAVNITVPAGAGPGYLLQSLTTGQYGTVSLTAGSNITISTTTSNITISSTASGGGTGTVSTSTNEVAGRVPYFTSNSGTPALLGQIATGTVAAGSTAITVTANRYVLNGALSIDCAVSSGSQAGCLSSADWTTFNNKSSFAYPFTVTSFVSTTSPIVFTQGISSMSSTTVNGLKLTDLTQGFPFVGSNGLVNTISTSTLSQYLFPNTSYGASTSTVINFINGLISLSTTTINGLKLTDLSQGNLYIGSSGKVLTQATSTCPTFSTGLSYSGTAAFCIGGTNGNVTVNTSQNITTLSNLTSNGLVYTAGGGGTLNVTSTTTLTASAPLSLSQPIFVLGGSASSLTCTNASSGVTGCLTGTDWTTFNNKLGSYDAWTHLIFGGTSVPGYSATTSQMAISTSTAAASLSALTVASSTANQLCMFGGAGINGWCFRNAGGTFYLSTTTVAGTATTSTPALSITGSGPAMGGIGTSTPMAVFSIVNQNSTIPPLLTLSSTTATNLLPNYEVDGKGHHIDSGPVPTVSSCGTSPVLTGNDQSGTVLVGSGASTVACTITFANSYGTLDATHWLVCPVTMATSSTAVTISASTTATTLVVGFSVSRSSNRFMYGPCHMTQ